MALRCFHTFFGWLSVAWQEPLHVFSVAKTASSSSMRRQLQVDVVAVDLHREDPHRVIPRRSGTSPVSSENVFLWTGQATLGMPFWSPIMPRDRTNSRRCGHMFWRGIPFAAAGEIEHGDLRLAVLDRRPAVVREIPDLADLDPACRLADLERRGIPASPLLGSLFAQRQLADRHETAWSSPPGAAARAP